MTREVYTIRWSNHFLGTVISLESPDGKYIQSYQAAGYTKRDAEVKFRNLCYLPHNAGVRHVGNVPDSLTL